MEKGRMVLILHAGKVTGYVTMTTDMMRLFDMSNRAIIAVIIVAKPVTLFACGS